MITMEQLRKYRFFNLTLIDLIPTLFVGLIIHSYIWLYPLELDIDKQSNRTFIQYIMSPDIVLSVYVLYLNVRLNKQYIWIRIFLPKMF
jgi:hypothetical protein